jgi:hypothetical protein
MMGLCRRARIATTGYVNGRHGSGSSQHEVRLLPPHDQEPREHNRIASPRILRKYYGSHIVDVKRFNMPPDVGAPVFWLRARLHSSGEVCHLCHRVPLCHQ